MDLITVILITCAVLISCIGVFILEEYPTKNKHKLKHDTIILEGEWEWEALRPKKAFLIYNKKTKIIKGCYYEEMKARKSIVHSDDFDIEEIVIK